MFMSKAEPKRGPKAPPRVVRPFDQWLHKQLHEMYDSIAQEPLPDDLIELVTPTKNPKS